MTIIVLTNCPPRLRGDLTKWMMEINTGVYVGRMSARVREKLWQRVCDNVKSGSATMVFHANNEQRMDFCVHNTTWQPIDFDGLKLMQRPAPAKMEPTPDVRLPEGFSKAAHQQKARRIAAARRKDDSGCIVAVDVETTGLDPEADEIIELAALRLRKDHPPEEFQRYIAIDKPIPPKITDLTGITDADLKEKGIPLQQALTELTAFLGGDPLVCHNAAFDRKFLLMACRRCGLPLPGNRMCDTLALARQKVRGVADYKLATLARHFGIAPFAVHRGLADCYTTCALYAKLNEK